MVTRENADYHISAEHQIQVRIGSELIPEYPVLCMAEAMSHLRKTVGKTFFLPDWKYRGFKYSLVLIWKKLVGQGLQV